MGQLLSGRAAWNLVFPPKGLARAVCRNELWERCMARLMRTIVTTNLDQGGVWNMGLVLR